MLKRLLTLVLCLSLVCGLSGTVTASESDGINVIVNDTVIELDAPVQVVDGATYVSCWPVIRALYPDAAATWQDGKSVITAPGLTLVIQPGRNYLIANGRYLYLPNGLRLSGQVFLVPARTLAAVLGADVAWDSAGRNVVFSAGTGPIASGDQVYQEDVVYWLSHIINAESGNQPLEGKVGVGNVVLNRVASSRFPNTVYEVIFQRGQFTPVANGSIYREPNEDSVIAAKLCLDGANTVGSALYFLNPRTARSTWAIRNCAYVATIGAHAFYA